MVFKGRKCVLSPSHRVPRTLDEDIVMKDGRWVTSASAKDQGAGVGEETRYEVAEGQDVRQPDAVQVHRRGKEALKAGHVEAAVVRCVSPSLGRI